ncbi:MAG: DEAD/DEAH box helicase, partial [Firmicutes bacterium]|nr:DEAD/DEAH box helicase [Bacillota bacterium]
MHRESLLDVLHALQTEPNLRDNIAHCSTLAASSATFASLPHDLDPRIAVALKARGIEQLYSHQATAFAHVRAGRHIVTVTPTASGKSLCYHLPILQRLCEEPASRALYLFPTKALAQDQKAELLALIAASGLPVRSDTYDGDTPADVRRRVRQAGHIVITNPDMLHAAILPHHTQWVSFFENLRFVVIDELHTYRGVFGSHVANVVRRLLRIAEFYGSQPQFACTSATIANPRELAEALLGRPVVLVDDNGAPAGAKHVLFYNPPLVNSTLAIRSSTTRATRDIAARFVRNRVQTIVFARSRARVEVLLTHLSELERDRLGRRTIRGYRGGYLPTERREIERGLRTGEILCVVSTNALELGVDIGQLQVCIMHGYPGSIASAWQQAGRAGRRAETSAVVLVASSSPLDQYIMRHPEYFFGRSPESARINPDNLIILVDHVKCAAFELPFEVGDRFGGVDISEILEFLADKSILHASAHRWHWMADAFPAHAVSLRSAHQDNVVIIDQSAAGKERVVGEMDRFSSVTLLHEQAIYLHQGTQYQVERLDLEQHKAYVREVAVDYYTDASLAVELRVLTEDISRSDAGIRVGFGDVSVRAMPTLFKKIKFDTGENVGSGPIHLPEQELQTTAAWIAIPDAAVADSHGERGWLGAAHALEYVAPLFAMCDPADLRVVCQRKAVHDGLPTIYLYDRYPGGIGLARHVFDIVATLAREAHDLIAGCGCEAGCPSCIGGQPDEGSRDSLLDSQVGAKRLA